jgi:hypothetical protein
VKKQPARLLVSFSFVPRDPDGKNVLEKLDERDKLLIGQLLKQRFWSCLRDFRWVASYLTSCI